MIKWYVVGLRIESLSDFDPEAANIDRIEVTVEEVADILQNGLDPEYLHPRTVEKLRAGLVSIGFIPVAVEQVIEV